MPEGATFEGGPMEGVDIISGEIVRTPVSPPPDLNGPPMVASEMTEHDSRRGAQGRFEEDKGMLPRGDAVVCATSPYNLYPPMLDHRYSQPYEPGFARNRLFGQLPPGTTPR
ncbi:MAG: hypothetical protein O3A01_04445 [bacterium]|nr:hypothetical protein [bacterium]